MNYNTEIILNPTDVNVDMVDFSIEISAGQDVIFVNQVNSDWNSTDGLSEILNKPIVPVISYLEVAPSNPKLNDIWVSSVTLIQYQWIGAWVNLNLQ